MGNRGVRHLQGASQAPEADPTDQLARRTVQSAGWILLARAGGRFLVLPTTILLARLLDQDDFGVAAYAITLINLLAAVPLFGIGPAVIYHRASTRLYDTAFWMSLAAATCGFLLLWFAAPLAGRFFDDPRATGVTRALSFLFPLQALRTIHSSVLAKQLHFAKRVFPELTQALTRGVVSVALALFGMGPWSLILGMLSGALAAVPAYWRASAWRPSFAFDRGVARSLLPYGGKVVGINLVGAFVRNIDYLIVGHALGVVALGVYTLAFRLPDLLVRQLSRILGEVLFPVFTRIGDDRERLKTAFVVSTRYLMAIVAPLSLGLALVAEPIVLTLFSAKWIACVPILPAICTYTFFSSLTFNVGTLLKALGNPGLVVKISLVRAAILLPAVIWAVSGPASAVAVGWCQAGVAFVAAIINLVVAHRRFEMPVMRAIFSSGPVVIACLAMALSVLLVKQLLAYPAPAVALSCEIASGALAYLAVLWWFDKTFVGDAVDAVRGALSRRSGRLVNA